ncbi:peptide chain release factor N(5)-glutamine methyltransferase [Salipiger bermudensis]|uniref:peptide chain release factor N(5)-glutamine methyltransferase n=1 Tax=Salipiger bermudensis TaxID=344736 RepID=UPI001C990CCF|nr:peptide chain release factor N(5)-glutamine methyltransferase [Salipiger bermudensis]MBY6005854.1 peptide chain release factor N(5)-glutamine methyltransferase [Salipiger bermudensis]
MTGSALLAAATRRLAEAGIPDPGRDARRLLAHVLKVPPGRLTLFLPDPVESEHELLFNAVIESRAARVPVSHLTGRRQFYGREFLVTPEVLDPRPETEILIEAALAGPFSRVLDLGTGSGCILLTLLAEREGATGIGTDLSQEALEVAFWNRNALRLEARAALARGDWFGALGEDDRERFDLIVSNPPYIALDEMTGLSPEVRDHEPRMALTDEGDGLTAYRRIAAGAPAHLLPGGRLMVEIGPSQGGAVADLFRDVGLSEVAVIADLDGRDRVVVGRTAAV